MSANAGETSNDMQGNMFISAGSTKADDDVRVASAPYGQLVIHVPRVLCRKLGRGDQPVVEEIASRAVLKSSTWKELLIEVANSAPFRESVF